MKHALVIGGTGMLREATLRLQEKKFNVTVVARNQTKMQKLLEQSSGAHTITPLYVDYSNEQQWEEEIQKLIKEKGEIDVVIAWVHSYASKALPTLIKAMSKWEHNWKLYHILGSSSNVEETRNGLPISQKCSYYQVQLGFMQEGNTSRWLTHSEISKGVIEAITSDQEKRSFQIGQIEPN